MFTIHEGLPRDAHRAGAQHRLHPQPRGRDRRVADRARRLCRPADGAAVQPTDRARTRGRRRHHLAPERLRILARRALEVRFDRRRLGGARRRAAVRRAARRGATRDAARVRLGALARARPRLHRPRPGGGAGPPDRGRGPGTDRAVGLVLLGRPRGRRRRRRPADRRARSPRAPPWTASARCWIFCATPGPGQLLLLPDTRSRCRRGTARSSRAPGGHLRAARLDRDDHLARRGARLRRRSSARRSSTTCRRAAS